MFGEALGAVGSAAGMSSLGGFALGGTMGLQTATSLYNIYQQERQYEYNKDLQQDIFHREDNAIQRRVRDLQAAGLSPVLAAGQGASAGTVVSTTAPQADDLAGKYMSLIKMKNDINMSQMQKELMEEQKYAATAGAVNSLANADLAMAKGAVERHNLRFYANQPGKYGMPTNMNSVGQNAGYIQGAVMELVDKTKSNTKNVYKSYDQKMGEYERKIEDAVKSGASKIKSGYKEAYSDPNINYGGF